MTVIVTGGAGFIGSHVAEYYSNRGFDVVCIDNLSRGVLLQKDQSFTQNWDYLSKNKNILLVKADVRNYSEIEPYFKDAEIVVHTAAQTAVTTSVTDPAADFSTNAQGTFNVLEAIRQSNTNPAVVYCSTNKVYGENVNTVPVLEKETRYEFGGEFKQGIPEGFTIDLCEHTPYGCSKLTGDLYMQDYAHLYGIKTGVFRMSCIYGTRQYGVVDQGWVAWFTIATLNGTPLTIYGNGKQVRDVLFVTDLVHAYDAFVNSTLRHEVFNMGGGPENTLSLLELLDILKAETDKTVELTFSDWRPSDQKVYISDIAKAKSKLGWKPKVTPADGVGRLVSWLEGNMHLVNR